MYLPYLMTLVFTSGSSDSHSDSNEDPSASHPTPMAPPTSSTPVVGILKKTSTASSSGNHSDTSSSVFFNQQQQQDQGHCEMVLSSDIQRPTAAEMRAAKANFNRFRGNIYCILYILYIIFEI